jgi:hypothetical protein
MFDPMGCVQPWNRLTAYTVVIVKYEFIVVSCSLLLILLIHLLTQALSSILSIIACYTFHNVYNDFTRHISSNTSSPPQ